MHSALWKLYRLRIRGSIRAIVRRFKSRRGAALGVFTLLFLGMMFGPSLVVAFSVGFAGMLGQRADWFREAAPVGMLLFVVLSIVTSLGTRALYFTPAEVDFLFPAPFPRRQILVYKILGSVTAAVCIALLFPISMPLYIHSWPAAAVGSFLAWLLLGSLTMCAQLVAQSVSERAYTRARKLLLGGVIVAAAVARGKPPAKGSTAVGRRRCCRHGIRRRPKSFWRPSLCSPRSSPPSAYSRTRWAGRRWARRWLSPPTRWQSAWTPITWRRPPASAGRSRSAGGASPAAPFLSRGPARLRSSRLPQPPWLGGAGPLLWRQAIQALRGSRGAILLTVIVVLAMGVPMALGAHGEHHGLPAVLPHIVIGVAAYATFLVSAQAPLGFQGDYERMELLKSLPVRPLAMAGGQMLVITVVLTLLQWSAFAVTAVCVPTAAAEMLAAGLFALPYNWILFGTENFLFLLYPSPRVATGSEGFLKMGRVVLFMLAKFFVLGVCGGLAAGGAAVVYLLSQSLPAACLFAWVTLLLPVLGIPLLVGWAFERYDVSAGASE